MKPVLAVVVLVALAGCTSVIRPFTSLRPDYSRLPANTVRQVAQEIEQAVQQGQREPAIADRDGVVVSAPAIVQAIRTRAARSEILNRFRDTGFAVELPNGRVEIDRGSAYQKATTRRERDRNALLVMQENADRWTIYEGLLKSSKLTSDALGAVQRIFYEERLKVMPDGQKYEDEKGTVVRKGG